MKKSRTLLTLLGTYSAVLLLAALIGITVLVSKLSKPAKIITQTVIETDYVYVCVGTDTAPPETDATTAGSRVWIVREYEERIGIFTEDGQLIRTIDVYTKTLPETDRRLLKEGIKITSEKQLNSLIEDYSS